MIKTFVLIRNSGPNSQPLCKLSIYFFVITILSQEFLLLLLHPEP